MRIRTGILALLLPVLIAGCVGAITAGNCLDALIPRRATSLAPAHVFELKFKDGASTSVRIACEKYYDAMCAARGNQWSVREIGSKEPAFVVKFLSFHDEQVGKIEIARPSCAAWQQQAPEKVISLVKINGELYEYTSTGSPGHLYSRNKFVNKSKPQRGPDTVVLDFLATYDGRVLQPRPQTPQ